MDIRVVSIGTLPAHPLWGERAPVRTGHATTTLIRAGKRVIVVDPGLPSPAIEARLGERANVTAREVTHVFLTSFQPDTFRGIEAFGHAVWWISKAEREGIGVPIAMQLRDAARRGDEALAAMLERHVAILKQCRPAPDELAAGLTLFPLHGVSPGLTGLVGALPRHTLVIAGDAVPTVEHLEQGQVLPWAADVTQARESFVEAIELADLVICGRDNLIVNPTRRAF
ncbi:MAG: MBL fold metallo-hydrolase [Phycisphaeraceae bacterium]|nr:MBL fold metallo-hydrolase [Phycisphaeraceae bacterium]